VGDITAEIDRLEMPSHVIPIRHASSSR